MAYDVAAGGQSVGLAKTQVHPLNELFLEMKEKLTNEDLKTILNLSKRRLDIKPGEDLEWQDYFNKLQETFAGDWESILEFLKEVFLAYDRHINDGTDKLTHVIENCEKKIRDEIRRIESYGIIKDKQFVGRTKEIEKITEFLSRPSSYIKGVCICGMAGMGKTSMASEICFNAKEVTTRRCLRGKKNLSEFYSEILRALMTNTEDSEFYDSNTRTEDVLKEAVHQKLSEIKTDIILFLDNIDDISDSSEHRFSDAVEELLNIKTEPEVKLLMTTRQKLRMIDEAPLKSVFVERFGRKLLEVELRSLGEEDAKKLLWCYAGESKVNNEVCREIVKLCGFCPLLVKIMGEHLKAPQISAHEVCQNLKSDTKRGTEETQVLNQMFESLSDENQAHLIQLSVFEASFDLKMAEQILDSESAELDLYKLCNLHLLEVEDDSIEWESEEDLSLEDDLDIKITLKGKGKKPQASFTYCFHPIMMGFFTTKALHPAYSRVKDFAEVNFIEYFSKQICESLGKNLEVHSDKAFAYIADNSVHLAKFFNLLLEKNDVPVLQHGGQKYVQTVQTLFKVRMYVGNHYEQLDFFQRLGEHKQKNGDELLLFYIRIQELVKHRMIQNKRSKKTVLEQLKTMLPNIDRMPIKSNPLKDLALATFYGLTGQVALEDARLQGNPLAEERILRKALENFDKALRNYQTKNDYVRSEISQMTNCKGCVYYLLKDYQNALLYHRKALEQLESFLKNNLHGDIPNILVNIGTVYLAKGAECQQDSEEAKKNYEESLKFFKKAEEVDKKLGYPDETVEARRLRNKADLFRRLHYYDDAARDARKSFRLFQDHFSPPHQDLTTTLYSMAYIEYCRGNHEKKKGGNTMTVNAEKAYKKAESYYVHIRRMVETGGLSQSHTEYKYVKRHHMNVLEALGKMDYYRKVDKFYRDFEAGKCDARIRQIQMDMEGHSSGSEKMSDNDEDNEELEDYSESDDSDGHVEVGGGQVVVGGGQVEVGGGQVVIGGGHVEVAGGQVEVAGGQVEVGAAGGEEARVGRHLSRLDSGVEIEDDEDEIFA